MAAKNILPCANKKEFREWLSKNSQTESECRLDVKRWKPVDDNIFYYLDAVQEALCFWWIDSTYKLINGKRLQRFSPRNKNSPWSELNKERARHMIKLWLMTKYWLAVAPDLDSPYIIPKEIEHALKKAEVRKNFISFPELYQHIRSYNVYFYIDKNEVIYKKSLNHLIQETKKGKMYWNWNDYWRLI